MRASHALGLGVAVVFALGLPTVDQASATGVEICDNGVDDTRGLIDCADPSCAGHPACNFETGCCILYNCHEGHDGMAAGHVDQADVTCMDNVGQVACADYVKAPPPCAGDPADVECTNDGLFCEDANLVRVSCAQVPSCPQFAPEVAAPAASHTGLTSLAILLAGSGFYCLRRRRS